MSDKKQAALQALANTHEEPFVLIDQRYTIVAANRPYEGLYGASPNDLVGRKCHEVSHQSAVPCHMRGEDCPLQQVMRTGQQADVVHMHSDARGGVDRVHLRGYPLVTETGDRLMGESVRQIDTRPEAENPDAPSREVRPDMAGSSLQFRKILLQLTAAACTHEPILLHGETGTGKELAARYLHETSPRQGKPFLTLDCTLLPEHLFESELFGHERGSFTGSAGQRKGLFELAHGGTLFLDELGELPLAQQAKLLRALECGTFRRLGSEESRHADVRIVAATNRDLTSLIVNGQFRADLFYRLSVFDITLPPLRQRLDDLEELSRAILQARPSRPLQSKLGAGMACRCSHPSPVLSPEALDKLRRYSFPGNVRELRNILRRAAAQSGDGIIRPEQINLPAQIELPVEPVLLPPMDEPSEPDDDGFQLRSFRRLDLTTQKQLLVRSLALYDGHRGRMAEKLGLSERTLYRKLTEFKLTDRAFAKPFPVIDPQTVPLQACSEPGTSYPPVLLE
jgi:transcriptional regulator with PAS, ATPase and Fis domain